MSTAGKGRMIYVMGPSGAANRLVSVIESDLNQRLVFCPRNNFT